jgi:hypothetical protein
MVLHPFFLFVFQLPPVFPRPPAPVERLQNSNAPANDPLDYDALSFGRASHVHTIHAGRRRFLLGFA